MPCSFSYSILNLQNFELQPILEHVYNFVKPKTQCSHPDVNEHVSPPNPPPSHKLYKNVTIFCHRPTGTHTVGSRGGRTGVQPLVKNVRIKGFYLKFQGRKPLVCPLCKMYMKLSDIKRFNKYQTVPI